MNDRSSSPLMEKDTDKKQGCFTSAREKRLWLFVLLITGAILSTLIIGRPLIELLRDQNLQAIFFLAGMLIIGGTMLLYGLFTKSSAVDLILFIGIGAVYLMLFLRLGLPERSHLIEYSVLALSIHQALQERFQQSRPILVKLYAFLLSFSIGLIDELIQLFLPDRVFDFNDIVFNGMAILLAIGISAGVRFLKRRWDLMKKKS